MEAWREREGVEEMMRLQYVAARHDELVDPLQYECLPVALAALGIPAGWRLEGLVLAASEVAAVAEVEAWRKRGGVEEMMGLLYVAARHHQLLDPLQYALAALGIPAGWLLEGLVLVASEVVALKAVLSCCLLLLLWLLQRTKK